jgi:lipid-binding SYLF domain-containing protein
MNIASLGIGFLFGVATVQVVMFLMTQCGALR